MRTYIDSENRIITVVLSERNLRAGLHKLVMPGSARELQSDDIIGASEPGTLSLKFETDDEHYNHPDRALAGFAGIMHPDTEAAIR